MWNTHISISFVIKDDLSWIFFSPVHVLILKSGLATLVDRLRDIYLGFYIQAPNTYFYSICDILIY